MILFKSVDRDPGYHGKSNSSSSIKHLQFINFTVNNRLGHFEQLKILLKMIQDVFDIWNW